MTIYKDDYSICLSTIDNGIMDLLRLSRNDERIWKWCRQTSLISDIDQENWYRKINSDSSIKMFSIRKHGSCEVFGVCGFTDINHLHQRAEFSLYVLPEFWHNGIGTEALEVLIWHGFNAFNFRNIWGETFDGNPALKIFEKIGFEVTGKRPEFYYKNGKFLDAHLVNISREKWLSMQS
jgi:RimJ/RimL family protein N-acetyltransferase